MTTANQQSAIAALNGVRPIAARLDRSREGEDRAADILELWEGTETALRALIGGSSLGGQGLIRELRQRELITLGQAYALLEFLGARDRANRTSYKSTPGDVDAAREGFRQLDIGLREGGTAGEVAAQSPSPYASGAATTATQAQPPSAQPTTTGTPASPSRMPSLGISRRGWMIGGGVLALLLVGLLGWALTNRGGDGDMDAAIEMMRSGRREAARGEFSRIARDNPKLATPHVFLARLAREVGDLATARRELETAIRAEPTNYAARREMGLVLFSSGDYELSRKFFVRALQANPGDLASQGYLGCALMRLGRAPEAQRFLSRAGPGAWTACATPAPVAGPPPLQP